MHKERSSNIQLLIWKKLSRRRRYQVIFLFITNLLSTFSEALTLGAVIPFLVAISDQDKLLNTPLIIFLNKVFPVTNSFDIVVTVTFIFCAAVLFSSFIRLINIWMNGHISALIGNDISKRCFENILKLPFEEFQKLNSSNLVGTITTEITSTTIVINQFLQLITSSFILIGLIIVLIFVEWKIAFSAGAIFGTLYFLVITKTKRRLNINSNSITESISNQVKSLNEGFGSFRDVSLSGNYNSYIESYAKLDKKLQIKKAENYFLSLFPRYTMEGIGLVVIGILSYILIRINGEIISVIPILGSLALGTQRLLPALQQIYSSWASIKGYRESVKKVVNMLYLNNKHKVFNKKNKPYNLKRSINFNSVSYKYNSEIKNIINNFNITIKKGEKIGIIGETGSGKSTLGDLLMGLLTPCSGKVLVDDIDINNISNMDLLSSWRKSIAHVPQNIFLADKTILENIAFGIDFEAIDYKKIVLVCKIVKIDKFINSLPYKYLTKVGERGSLLSGGECQRIGIARALYKGCKVLILDEATSALDEKTEDDIMINLNKNYKNITLIMITHRLKTIKNFDRVFKFNKGNIDCINLH